jgi:hypothetical protein
MGAWGGSAMTCRQPRRHATQECSMDMGLSYGDCDTTGRGKLMGRGVGDN